jgi:HEPN domain-containing protein
MGQQCPFATVCFHAQQLVEKYLKALLAFHSVPFPKTHDLAELVSALRPSQELLVDSAQLGLLKRYAVEARYPGDWEPITRQESDEAVRIAKRVGSAIRWRLPDIAGN